MKRNYTKILFVVLFAIMCIGIMLLLWVGMYNAPSSDDYGYAIWTHMAWESSHSMMEVIKKAIYTSKHFWNQWQGLYSSAFVLAFMPNIFGEGAYAVTAFITIASVLIGNGLFIQALTKKILYVEKMEAGILIAVSDIMMLQWMPSAVQGIYWYNGAMNYTFFYMLMLLEFTVMIYYASWQSFGKDVTALIGLSGLGFVVAGGNHITAFFMLLVLFAATVAGFLRHKRKLQLLVIPFMISMGGFIFNITSPGTKVRQAAFEMRPGIFGTIVLSIEKTLEDLNDWLNFSFVLMLIILIPILLNMAIRIYKNTGFRFSNPLLIVIISVGCLCLLRCPPYYAMGNDGAGRIDNIVFFVFVLFSIANEFYILGWLYAKGYLHIGKGTLLSGKNLVCIILLLLVSAYGSKGDNNFYEAYCELKSGEVQQYNNENEARWNVLLDGTKADVILQPHSVKPKLLFFSDIEHDPADGKNSSMKEYYKKNTVSLGNENR